MNSDEKLDEFAIYRKYLDMLYYINRLIKKYPKSERFDLTSQIKNVSYEGMKCVLKTYKAYDRKEKLKYLNELDMNLKVLKVLIRISYRSKYINKQNYAVWSNKIAQIGNLMYGWMKWVSQLKDVSTQN